jgi:hypothetical protein
VGQFECERANDKKDSLLVFLSHTVLFLGEQMRGSLQTYSASSQQRSAPFSPIALGLLPSLGHSSLARATITAYFLTTICFPLPVYGGFSPTQMWTVWTGTWGLV